MTARRVAVVDYGMGNLRSVVKALVAVGAEPSLVDTPAGLRGADAVVLPGVGSLPEAARRLAETGLDAALRQVVADGRPFLGICLGMQLLFDRGEEGGGAAGLGLLAGEVTRLSGGQEDGRPLKVPHIGWNAVAWDEPAPLMEGLEPPTYFYFVHSYAASWPPAASWSARARYGSVFTAAVGGNGVWGVQFHPEKSGRAGLTLLRNFARMCR